MARQTTIHVAKSRGLFGRVLRAACGAMLFASMLMTATNATGQSPLATEAATQSDYGQPDIAQIAEHIADALGDVSGERILVRHDPVELPELAAAVVQELSSRRAFVALISYEKQPDFERLLDASEVCIWLPRRPFKELDPVQQDAIREWLDARRGREVHFHASSVTFDGLPVALTAQQHEVQYEAIDIDHAELHRRMQAATALLRNGVVRVTTPSGTDIRFAVGDRPAILQYGDASLETMKSAVARVDRQIEAPAGALRIAPIEQSVSGRFQFDRAGFGEGGRKIARGIDVAIRAGKAVSAGAKTEGAAVRAAIEGAGFREFALGFNPKLIAHPRTAWLPYFGYGAGVVRLAFGDNSELSGAVANEPVRLFFFMDADVVVEGAGDCKIKLVENGVLNTGVLDSAGGSSGCPDRGSPGRP